MRANVPVPPTVIDPTLTPQTAPARGYQFVTDLAYSMLTTQASVIADLLAEGYKLGSAAHKCLCDEKYIGLYAPLLGTQKQQKPAR